MKPVTAGMSNWIAMRPETGVQPSPTENVRISSSPHQKIGIEKPVSEAPITEQSHTVMRLTAAMTPAGSPMSSASSIAQTESSIVAGKRAKNLRKTDSWVTVDKPRSPCSAFQT